MISDYPPIVESVMLLETDAGHNLSIINLLSPFIETV